MTIQNYETPYWWATARKFANLHTGIYAHLRGIHAAAKELEDICAQKEMLQKQLVRVLNETTALIGSHRQVPPSFLESVKLLETLSSSAEK
jgi:hypothetical protein